MSAPTVSKSGVVCLDKPTGMTSFRAVSAVRHALGFAKAGHCGTLDPMATGVLPIALGEATKLVQFLVDHDKSYRATVRLGQATDTQDADGAFTDARPWEHVTEDALLAAAAGFVGVTRQKVPMYSAVRVDGERLHARARRGEVVDTPERDVHITAVRITRVALPDFEVELDCGRGTYVRAFAVALAQALGTAGHLIALRRTRVGVFTEANALTLDALRERAAQGGSVPLLDLRDALGGALPEFAIDAEEAAFLWRSGHLPYVARDRALALGPTERLALISPAGLAAVARVTDVVSMLRVMVPEAVTHAAIDTPP